MKTTKLSETFTPEPFYIMSKPPKEPFLYHHSHYTGLKRIADTWTLEAGRGKHTISLTTDPGRFLSPLPMLADVTIDGIIKMPLDNELSKIAIPALYSTREVYTINRARELGYSVFSKDDVPSEYKYIMRFVTHGVMFIDENEYTVIADRIGVPAYSVIYVHPKKLKRFKSSLGKYSIENVRSLEELIQ